MIQSPAGYQGDVRIKRYLDFYQAGYGVAMLSSGTTAFSPASLFAASEPGGWYDPSDLTTLYQDAAGTTPVTAVEQPVGLVLDKSRGLVLGSELVSNGGFDSASGWTINGGGVSITGGVLTASTGITANIYSTISPASTTRTFKVSWTLSTATAGDVILRLYNNGANVTVAGFTYLGTAGTYTAYVQTNAAPNQAWITIGGGGFTGTIDNISVRELPGSHLSQSTAAARPVLSARVNLLTYTEQFDNAAWTKAHSGSSFPVVTANQAVAPDGTTTADEIAFGAITTAGGYSVIYQDPTGTSAVRLASVWVKAKSAGDVGKKIHIYTNASTDVSSYTLTADWQRITSPAAASTNPSFTIGALGSSFSGGGNQSAFSAYIWGADLRPANAGVGLPAYQRVGAATSGSSTAAGNADYDSGPEWPRYLRFDGTDDFLQSSTITPGSVDKAQVFAGVRKLSDAAAGVVAEYSNNVGSQNGSFLIDAPDTPAQTDYGFYVRGTIANEAPANGFAAPDQAVLTMQADISAASNRIIARRNAVQTGTSGAASLGTGNFGTYPLYIGRRDGTSLPFNGNLYQLLVRFSAANMDAATITATETWVNGKTKAF